MSAKKWSEKNAKQPNRLPNIFEESLVLTRQNVGWSKINLETLHLRPGETPEFALNHPVVAVNIGKEFYAEQIVENSSQRKFFFQGAIVICPMHCCHSFRWEKAVQILALNLEPDLLSQSATELLGIDNIELAPHFSIQDALIQQIGLALYAELQTNNIGGRLYAETLANALAVHLLQYYSSQRSQPSRLNAGVTHQTLRLVIDYINDNIEHNMSLKELAAIAQLNQYHFCRVFKQVTGLSPHQYLIQQRIEKAKVLLRSGMSIGAVAIACGFTHQSHLHRHFKYLTGVTPKKFLNS